MKHAHTLKRAMAVVLALVLTLSLVTPTWAMSSSSVATKGENNGITWEKVDNIKLPIKENAAVEEDAQQQYADTDVVRVSIVLSDPSTLDKGFSASDIASGSKKAMKYRDKLESKQDKMAKTISKKALDGQSLDVVWNLTLATNIISANVQYGQIEKIEKIKGVDSVLIETQYEPCVVKESETTDPNMATSSSMIGSSVAWADGYTGAGSKVAIIDTGADTDHPSLSGAAYSYAVKGLGITPVTAADYADKLEKLNALKKNGDLKASDLYVSAKIPFGFNYIDADLDVTHDNDKQGDHGSHVTGIAAGNRYIEQADGSFAPALDTALTQGVAPDAQVYTMKVFGKGGGAYDSDYMAAIEDAMILGCDSANLSLGSGNPGYSRQSDAKYQAILEAVVNSGMVVAMSAGNSGHWFENTPYAYPYAESVSWATNGSPGSYTNSLGVASVDNVGSTGNYIEFAGVKMFYNDTSEAPIQPMTALAGEQRFVYVDAVGNPEDFAAAGDELKGAIAMCNRGEINFTAKGNNAVAAGAIGTVVVNNDVGTINMSTDGYTGTAPYVSLLMSDGQIIKANAEKKEANGVTYYVGKLTVGAKPGVNVQTADYYTMSDFSSWGIPGSLELKPEITAPGGNIYSLQNGGGYQNMSGTSMASPQVAGMAAVVAQYIRANKLTEKTGLTARALAQSLLMSTAVPMYEDYGEGKYGYSNGGSWRNAQGYIGINNAPTKAAEGEKITVKVTEAPEYYVTYDAEGNATTNWDALGDGASRTYTAFIDRTEPVLSNVYFKEDVETGTRSLVLTAQDNRYVAAAFLIDYDKMSILDGTAGSPEGAAEGAATDISLDLSKAEGVDHLYIQVCDYANNAATYKINLNKEELSGPVSVTLDKQSIKMYKGGTAALNAEVSPFGVKPDGVTWKSSDETVATVNERGIITGVNKGTATITAASIKDPTATASCVVTVQTVDTTLVGALMDTNGDAQFYTWDMEHDTTWKKLVNFETTKSVSASTFDARTGDVYLQDGSFNINKMDLDTGKTLATYPGFEGEIPMWDMEYSLVYSTEAKPMLASVYYTYFLSPKPVDNLDLSAFDLGLYLWLFADASYFTAVTSLGANKIDTDKDGVKDTDTELFLALDDAGNIWTMNVYPSVDKETGKDTWGASFGIIESNLANVGYAANPTDDGDLYDSLYATAENNELVLYLANCTGDASHVYRILLNEDTGKWEAADIGNFGDGVWPATLVGTMYHANEDAAKAVNAAMSKTTVHTAQAVEMTPAQIQRYNGAETQAAKGSLNTAAPVAAVVNLPMGDAAENATASNVTVSADEKTVTVNVLAKDAATNGLFTVDYDAANLTLTNVAFNTQYSSYKDASGKVTLGYVDLNGVAAGSTVATLTFTVNDPTALDKINVTVTETERNDQTVNNAETLTADLHTETETVNAKAATCTEDGYTGDVVCKACGKVITKGEVIPALGHKIELVGAKEPTCTEDGYTGDEVCTICGEIVKKGEVIKATGHQYKDGKCTVCGAADPNYKPSVKTGDESNTALWVLVMASAAMLAAAVVVLPRKKHSR